MKTEDPVLLVLIPGFPENEMDSTCLPAQQLFIKTVNKLFPGVRLLILSFQYPYQQGEYTWHGNRVIAFGGKNRGGLSRLFLWQRIKKKLDQLKKENTIAGVLSFWAGETCLVGKKWADKNGLKHYSWLRGQDAKAGNKYIKRIQPRASELIAISDFISRELEKNHGILPQYIIPAGIDPGCFTETNNKREIDILCAGSLIPLKRYHLCIEVLRQLKEEFPSLKMVLCGKGPEEEKLRSLVSQYRLENNVTLAGERTHGETLSLMQQSRLFLHPSSYEGFSGACLEALAAGAQVISFHQPMREPISKWHLVNSVEEMKEKTATLLKEEPDLRPVCTYTADASARKVLSLFGL
jgi:glycosyltransferase involved in cell wall biosynthesis